MFCINCGQTNIDNSNFCRFCGTNFPASQPPPNQRQTGANYQPPPINNPPINNPPPNPSVNNSPNNYKPYGWASDSLQGKISPPPQHSTAAKTQPIRQVQPLPPFAEPTRQPQPLAQMPGYTPPQVYQTNQNLQTGYHCPRCGTTAPPQFTRKISAPGWIIFAVLLIVFFPLFWIGLLIKEEQRVCPICLARIG